MILDKEILESIPIKGITLVGTEQALIYPLYHQVPYKMNLPKKNFDKVGKP